MNSKKRWIITVIIVLALAAVVGIGIVLNHSADRVLKAVEGTEEAAEDPQIAEEAAELPPVENTLEMELPAAEKADGMELPAGGDTAVSEIQPEVLPGNQTEVLPGDQPEVLPETQPEVTHETLVTTEANADLPAAEEGTIVFSGQDQADEDEDLLQTSAEQEENPEEEADEETEEETEEEETEEEGEPELRAEAPDGAQIVVRKTNGTFPAGAYVKVLLVSADSAQSAVEEALEENAELVGLVAYDITIYDRDGNEIIPDRDVQVSILGTSLESSEGVSVYHIDENGDAEKLADVEDAAQASFPASQS